MSKCVTKVSKQNLSVHKKSCSVGTLFCSKCPNFSTKSQNGLSYHIAKKHGAPNPTVAHICKICKDKFTGFYALRQHKSQVHGHNIKTSDDSSHLFEGIDDDSLKEELRACQHFLLIRNWKKDVREFSILHWHLLVLKKSTQSRIVFQKLKCAAKIILAFGFVLKIIEDTSCRYFYAHENNTVFEKSKLLSTGDNLEHIKTMLPGKDVIESCTRERVNTKWKFLKLTNVTIFAALLKDIPLGCKDAVSPEPLLPNRTFNCLTFEKKTQDNLIMTI